MITWKDAVIHALEQLNGHAYLNEIYQKVVELGEKELSRTYQATIRATLERFSEDSTIFNGEENCFYSVDGLGMGHWGLIDFTPALDTVELTTDDAVFLEGRKKLKQHIVRERNYRLVFLAKKTFKEQHTGRLFCEACNFCFKDKYGVLGENFIEAHHIKPISALQDDETTRVADLMMLCSNCHSMVHRIKEEMTKEDIVNLLSQSFCNTML